MTGELTLYRELLADIKVRVRQAQHKAALSANAEMILMYWDIGRMIAARQKREGWGAGVIPRLAVDLKNELPEEKGFSDTNLKRMVQFSREYPDLFPIGARPVPQLPPPPLDTTALPSGKGEIGAQLVPHPEAVPPQGPMGQRAVSQLSWGHNVILIQKLKHLPTRLWYARQTLEHGWSRHTLALQIKNRAYERHGAAVTNFAATLPDAHASLAQGLLKDPYLFDFLTLEEPFHERELETGLLYHLQKFLLELGRGFAFVGRQYRLEVSDREFYLDLLFYHLHLRCFVVVELKKGDFKPEYAGKMNFYCSAVDDLLRHPQDQPTLGLILCQTKDRILAEYALRDIHKPIGIADYELTRALPKELASSLPSIEAIEAELSRDFETAKSESPLPDAPEEETPRAARKESKKKKGSCDVSCAAACGRAPATDAPEVRLRHSARSRGNRTHSSHTPPILPPPAPSPPQPKPQSFFASPFFAIPQEERKLRILALPGVSFRPMSYPKEP